jgi:hypothetical protein
VVGAVFQYCRVRHGGPIEHGRRLGLQRH